MEEEEKDSPQETTPTFTDTLIETFLQAWKPAQKNDAGTELKSTLDIIDEMAAMTDAEKWEINTALSKAGFKTTYVDGGYYWMLLPR